VDPATIVAFVGVIAIEERVAEVRESVICLLVPATVAVIVMFWLFPEVGPESAVARPELLMEIEGEELVQFTCEVTSCVPPSLKVAVTINCSDVPAASDGLAGETLIEVMVALPTVTVVVAEIEPWVACMTTLPGEFPTNTPLAVMEAFGDDVVQMTLLVRSCVF
jgi:hypothetical protein